MKHLLIDAGNTRLKWGWAHERSSEPQPVQYDALKVLAGPLGCADAIWIASVAGAERNARVSAMLDGTASPVHWLRACSEDLGVRSAYDPPESLGVDRWLSLLAARARSPGAVLVVTAGTALTIDALSAEGEFMGGLIVPGLRLMRESLESGTAGVSTGGGGQVHTFPTRTGDAVESGTLFAAIGAIEHQYRSLAERTGMSPRCLVGGGDADALLAHLTIEAERTASLVLEGMARVALARSDT